MYRDYVHWYQSFTLVETVCYIIKINKSNENFVTCDLFFNLLGGLQTWYYDVCCLTTSCSLPGDGDHRGHGSIKIEELGFRIVLKNLLVLFSVLLSVAAVF